MTYEELLENARPEMGKYCKACPVCNGKRVGTRCRDREQKVWEIRQFAIMKMEGYPY